jgi:hypothetical protein
MPVLSVTDRVPAGIQFSSQKNICFGTAVISGEEVFTRLLLFTAYFTHCKVFSILYTVTMIFALGDPRVNGNACQSNRG